jgi:predicted phage terminase large subunit-like protein
MSTSLITSLLPPPQTPISLLSPSQAAALLLQRRAIRASLTTWCTEALSGQGLSPAPHHTLLLGHLEAVSRGDCRRLMVLMPPGSAKSTYASVLFPAWHLANNPQHALIAASHTSSLAERFGRRVRNLLAEYGPSLGITLSPDIQAAGQWETTGGGEYFAAGVDGPIAGRRADLAIIDDPVKSRSEADSATISERNWEWWKNDLLPRLKPGGRVILIMTRWSEIDLGGRLLDDMASGGAPWTVLKLPMEAENNDPLGRGVGEPLWPEWFTAAQRTEAKRDPRTWSALYQQSPSPDTGIYFERAWLRPVNSLPPRESLRVYGASDYAVTSDAGDWSVHVVVGVDPSMRLWLLDVWRGQTASDEWVESFCDLVLQWKPLGWAEETGQIRAGVGPFMARRQRERKAYVARRGFPTRGDKSVRAQSIRGRMAMDGLHYPANAPWATDLIRELMTFPAGKHDDQVDALGLIGQLLDVMAAGEQPAKDEPPRGLQEMTMAEAWKLANPRERAGSGARGRL